MSHRRKTKLTLNKVNFLDEGGIDPMGRDESDRRRRRSSIAGDGLSGPEVVLVALLNHRSPGVSPGTWESRGMSPTGYPGYPTPLPRCIEPRRAGGRPSGLERVASTDRGPSYEEFPEGHEVVQTALTLDLPRRVAVNRTHLPL